MHLKDRIAVVTGASMGIGAATAVGLARKGVTVYAVARNRENLETVAARHSGIHPIVADVSIAADRERVIEAVGPVDILVNNAGISAHGLIEIQPFETIRSLYETNVMGLIHMTQLVLPGMLGRRRGHICNVGSSISYLANPPLTAYASTKYAVEGFTDGLRREVFHRGVGVSLIQPGPVKTAFWDRSRTGDRADVSAEHGTGIPPEWVSNAIIRAIRFDRLPSHRHVAVPRPIGLGRLFDVPGVATVIDVINRFRTSAMDVVQIPPDQKRHADADVIPITDARADVKTDD